jgi:hypothetical protein
MTTAAPLAGADGVIAGLWALPADPECTGQIVADCLDAVRGGAAPAEALRQHVNAFSLSPAGQFVFPASRHA